MCPQPPRHMDDHAKLSPEGREKLVRLAREKGRPTVCRMLHLAACTLDNLLTPLGGAKRKTILKVEDALKEIDA